MASSPNLSELNELLADKYLDLPFTRRTVDNSGRNLAWLRKHAGSRNKLSPRLQELLAMSIQELVG